MQIAWCSQLTTSVAPGPCYRRRLPGLAEAQNRWPCRSHSGHASASLFSISRRQCEESQEGSRTSLRSLLPLPLYPANRFSGSSDADFELALLLCDMIILSSKATIWTCSLFEVDFGKRQVTDIGLSCATSINRAETWCQGRVDDIEPESVFPRTPSCPIIANTTLGMHHFVTLRLAGKGSAHLSISCPVERPP